MQNYKIKVNNEAESKEAQELFFELGYRWYGYGATYISIGGFKFITAYSDEMRLAMGWGEDADKELTLPELRDMVSVYRKPEQGLINGADALRAIADGKEVEYWCENDPSIQKRWTPIKALNEYRLSYFLEDKPRFEFRLKPSTIKLSLEIPAPFEPKNKDECFHLDYLEECGFSKLLFDLNNNAHHKFIQYGAWRTESEIKQVVAALRGALKNG